MESNGRTLDGKFATGHPGYKKKGMPEFQRETRETLWAFFQDKMKQLPEIFEKLTPRDQAKVLMVCHEFFLPKQREIILETNGEAIGATIDYTKLSPAALKEVLTATKISENGTLH